MILVRLPDTLRTGVEDVVEVHDPVETVGELVDALDRLVPGLRDQLDDSVFNFAVNDEMLLYGARERALRSGDTVEIVPAISGG